MAISTLHQSHTLYTTILLNTLMKAMVREGNNESTREALDIQLSIRPTSRVAILVLVLLVAAPIMPVVAEWCWIYADNEMAINPHEWECDSAPVTKDNDPNTEDAADYPEKIELQRIIDEHMNWHCTNGHIGAKGGGSGPGVGEVGFGEQFLVYHKQEIYAFDLFRNNALGLDDIEIWDPNDITDVNSLDYNPMPWGIPGCDGQLIDGECPPSNPGVPPARAGGSMGECIYGTGRSGDGVDESTFTACADCVMLDETYRGTQLQSFASADDLGSALDGTFHKDFHVEIGYSIDNDGNGCEDMWYTSASPRDAMFWRAHKALDEVHHQWLASQPADVVVLLDRSGSMNQQSDPWDDASPSKMDAAKSGAAFFSDLIENDASHTVGVLTFSTHPSAAAELPLAEANENSKTAVQNSLSQASPAGTTGIGEALIAAQNVLDQGPNDRKVVLLLTDGKENECPRVQDPSGICNDYEDVDGNGLNDLVTDALGDTQVCAVGYGGEAGIDGLMLRNLTERQGGIYVHGVGELDLKQFFLRCFSSIFNFQEVEDPIEVLPAATNVSSPIAVSDLLSDSLTFVLAWEEGDPSLDISIHTPSGTSLDLSGRDIEASSGPTWRIIRLSLPLDGEESGEWTASVVRTEQGADQRYFLDVLASGGPILEFEPAKVHTHTGDTLRVKLRIPTPSRPIEGFDSIDARVTITAPDESIGALLSQYGLINSSRERSESIGPVQASLEAIWNGTGGMISTSTSTYQLYDDGTNGDLFANNHYFSVELPTVAEYEGHYELYFEVDFTYQQRTLHREMRSTLYVSPGIAASAASIQISDVGTDASGDQLFDITLAPQDSLGNPLGPGRPSMIGVELGSGVMSADDSGGTFVDQLNDNYTLRVVLDADAKDNEAIVKLTQNGNRLYVLNLATGQHEYGPLEHPPELPAHWHLNQLIVDDHTLLDWELQSTEQAIEPGDSVFITVDARNFLVWQYMLELDFGEVMTVGTDKTHAVLSGDTITVRQENEFTIEVEIPIEARVGDKFVLNADYGVDLTDSHPSISLDSLTIEVGVQIGDGGGGLPGWSLPMLIFSLAAAGIIVERRRLNSNLTVEIDSESHLSEA